jgi:hypothetical protein
MAQHPRSRWISYWIIISAKNEGSVTLVSAAGKPSGRRLRRRRLSLPREKNSREPPATHVAIIR